MKAIFKALGALMIVAALIGGFFLNSQRDALLEKIIPIAEEKAAEMLNTPVKIGKAEIEYWSLSRLEGSQLVLRDVEIFDKKSELIARADLAKVSFNLLAALENFFGSGINSGVIDEINITGAQANLIKREDNSWNFNDIKPKSSTDSDFGAKIFLTGGNVNAAFDGKTIAVENISGSADCANINAIDIKIDAETLGSKISAIGTVGLENQIVTANVDTANVAEVLSYLPENLLKLPEGVEIRGGTVNNVVLNVLHRDEILSYSGSANLVDGAVKVVDTEIEKISGSARFTDAEINFVAQAQANSQTAKASGSIRTDTDKPFFDIDAESDYFEPAAIFESLGVKGAVQFSAHMAGTFENPQVEGEVSSSYLAYNNISAQNISAHVKYFDNAVSVSEIRAESFGGVLRGEAEVQAQKLAYNAHVKATDINIAQVRNFFDIDLDFNGNVSADVAANGIGADLKTLKIFGEATADNVTYENFAFDGVSSSFFVSDDDVKIDYLNVQLPGHGKFNVEGTIVDKSKLDLEFYGAHVDLALAKKFDKLIDVSGLSDFKGSVHGDIDNPKVAINLSAVDSAGNGGFDGIFFNQPYDSIMLAASGNLDNLSVDRFELEKGGKLVWTVIDGVVNMKGEKSINLRLDTIGARVENIITLITNDFQVTGNIDNTIRITGTLEKPHIVGYAEFNYGSFKYGDFDTILLTSLRGDYFVQGNTVRVQDFVVTSPMVDMVLNGTLDLQTYDMDFTVEGRDIDLRRFQGKFPNDYPVSGHGTFAGELKGNFLKEPTFDGQLTAPAFTFNGVEVHAVQGHINAKNIPGVGLQLTLDNFNFYQGNGKYSMQLTANTTTKSINGKVEVRNVSIPELAALANKKSELLKGKLSSEITLGGTTENLSGKLKGEIVKGELAGYDLHDVNVDINLANQIVYVQKFAGKQGKAGEFDIRGTASLVGPLALIGKATNLELGIIGAAAGLDAEFIGTTNIEAKINGSIDNPDGEFSWTANGGIQGSTFDLMRANILLRNWVFNVKEFIVNRKIGDKLYQASAQGTIPIQALTMESGAHFAANDQMNLKVSLDDADLSLLPVMSDMIAWSVGKMGGNVMITGTASRPQINGQISLKDGSVKVKGMTSPIEHINISTQFKGNRFDIEKFVGNIGSGNFEVTGGLSFADYTISNYNFDLAANALDIRSTFFTGPINGEFNLSEGRMWRHTLPKISGHLDFDKCTISVPTIPDSDSPLPEILMDVTINLGDKVHFYSSRLYNMYLTGSVKFENTTLHPKTSGLISVKRGGTVTYIQTVFNIREGEALFNQMDSFFPSLNLTADATVSNVKVELSVDGTLGDMNLKLHSTPEMNSTEIAQLLTLRDASGRTTENLTVTDIVALGLQMSILGDIEDSVKRTFGLDKFTFSSGSGTAFEDYSQDTSNTSKYEFNVSVGKYVSDKFMLRYTQGINGDRIKRYGFQYDLNDNLGVTLEREDNEYIFSLEARYKF